MKMDPIRVLQVFARLDTGGAESMIMSVYRNIDRNRVQFDFVVNENDTKYIYEHEINELGGKVFRMPKYTIINNREYGCLWEILLKKHSEWKIIHGHHTAPAFIYLRIGKALNRITIAHSHTAGGELRPKSKIKILMRYPLRHLSDHRFACSDSAARWMFGKRNTSTHILNNAIDPDKFAFKDVIRRDVRQYFGVENNFVIGHVGRFQPEKNHDFIIRVFKTIHDKNDKAFLFLVGDGDLCSSIKKKVKTLGLSGNVLFAGIRSDVPDLLQAMDIFLFPSNYEGLGIVAVEAQAAGLKTIVSEAVPQEAYVTDLIERESLNAPTEKWADRILKYTDGYNRIDTSEQIKARGYDIKEVAKWLEKFYIKKHEESFSTKQNKF